MSFLCCSECCFGHIRWITLQRKYFVSLYGSSGCVGLLAKLHSTSSAGRKLTTTTRKNRGQQYSCRRRQWSSSPGEMEKSVECPHSHEANPSDGSTLVNEDKKLAEKTVNSSSFINQAAIAWNERRKEWLGNQSEKSRRMPREPILSWSTTYDDLLSTNQHFSEPIPLPEMVDFLVDIWHQEGLYDQ